MIAREGLNNGGWVVDSMIAGNGWWYVTLQAVLRRDYLMRAELIDAPPTEDARMYALTITALHSVYSAGSAQFYMSCANISVIGSGTQMLKGGVAIPGV